MHSFHTLHRCVFSSIELYKIYPLLNYSSSNNADHVFSSCPWSFPDSHLFRLNLTQSLCLSLPLSPPKFLHIINMRFVSYHSLYGLECTRPNHPRFLYSNVFIIRKNGGNHKKRTKKNAPFCKAPSLR